MRIYLNCFFCLAIFLFNIQLSAQDFTKVDAQARATAFPKNQDIKGLAKTLGTGLTTEKEKVRAIYVWITANIRYDVKSFENRKELDPEEKDALQEPAIVLKRKSAVCAGYSSLFCALCEAAGIEALVVTGITKNHKGRVSRIGHAWNLARTDGQWVLIDATWGAGDVDLDEGKYTARFKDSYFCMPPETSILDHYPEDPLFQLLPQPLTVDEFKQDRAVIQQKLSERTSDKTQTGYNVKDSLDAFVLLDSTVRIQNSSLRILRFDPGNNKGLYGLAMLQFREASGMLKAVNEEINRLSPNQGNKQQLLETLDRNISQLTAVEAKWNESIATLDKITGAGGYYKPARQMVGIVRRSLADCSKYKESLVSMSQRLKK